MTTRSILQKVLEWLDSAHQCVAAINERANIEVYWSEITVDIQNFQNICYNCNRAAPTLDKLPSIPFEPLLAWNLFKDWYYLFAVDRLSSWTKIFRIQQGLSESGSSALCFLLRKMFSFFAFFVKLLVTEDQSSLLRTNNHFSNVRVYITKTRAATHHCHMAVQTLHSKFQYDF